MRKEHTTDTFRAIIRGPKDDDELRAGLLDHLVSGYTYTVETRSGLTGAEKFWIVVIKPTGSTVASDVDEMLEEWQSISDEISPPTAQLLWFERIPAKRPKYDAAVEALRAVSHEARADSASNILDAILAAVREERYSEG